MKPEKLHVDWSYPALVAFYRLHLHEAMAVDRGVIRFAERREGHVERIGAHYRLHIGAFRVRFALDGAETMTVLYLYRVG